MYFIIKALLSRTSSCVQINREYSTEWFKTVSGVKQGDNISPTLFGLYINDLVGYLKENCPTLKIMNMEVNCLLYADDLVLVAESPANLQHILNELHKWFGQWKMKVNIDKTKIVHLRKPRQNRTDFTFKLNDQVLEKVGHYKYLGVYIDEFLKYDLCAQTLSASGSRALGSVINKSKSIKGLGYSTYSTLFNSCVKPILEYGSGVWGHVNAQCIDMIFSRAKNYFLGVHKYAPKYGVTGDMGWLDPKFGRAICKLRLWNRLVKMDNSRLTKVVFEWDMSICKNNWSDSLKTLLCSIDMLDIFQHRVPITRNLVDIFKTKMSYEWKRNIETKPKLRTYIKFKKEFETEEYVKSNISRYTRSLFAQFRLGILPLKIESGRFKRQPLAERICENCTLNEIEDEIHFLCKCPLYSSLRFALFKKATELSERFNFLSEDDKFLFLMNNMWRDVAHFVVNAWRIRQHETYI